jgi:CheY-like chemotaxis protein
MQKRRQTGRRPRILHVEDDADLGCVVSTLLADLAEVVVAPTLAAAKCELSPPTPPEQLATRYDLVILDLGLPDGSGLDLLPTVKALPYALPVIVFSASETDPQAFVQGAIAAVLVKSRTSNERLLQIISQLTSNGDNAQNKEPI